MDLHKEIDKLIDIALGEDVRSGDITSRACIPESATTSGRFFLRQAGVIAGLPFLETVFHKVDPKVKITILVEEGSYQRSGTHIAKISGPAQSIFTGERVALNLIQHASGVATVTGAFVRKLRGIDCAILDTRKTLPGLRALEKYAVQAAGGVNHRYGLDDRFIIKGNHLVFLAGNHDKPIQEAVRRVRKENPNIPVEIEIKHMEQLEEALATDAEAIMLNTMMPDVICRAVKRIRQTDKKVFVESMGSITIDTVRAYADTSVDGIAIGSLTHSAECLDIRMRLTT